MFYTVFTCGHLGKMSSKPSKIFIKRLLEEGQGNKVDIFLRPKVCSLEKLMSTFLDCTCLSSPKQPMCLALLSETQHSGQSGISLV